MQDYGTELRTGSLHAVAKQQHGSGIHRGGFRGQDRDLVSFLGFRV